MHKWHHITSRPPWAYSCRLWRESKSLMRRIFNKPGVAGAVLQSPPWFINWLREGCNKFFWENVHPTLCIMCHMSCVPCHMSCVMSHVSHVMCHLSRVTCHLSKYYFFNFHFLFCIFRFFCFVFYHKKIVDKVMELVGGGSVINGAYPV